LHLSLSSSGQSSLSQQVEQTAPQRFSGQVKSHAPATQIAVPVAGAVHAMLHALQCRGFVLRFVSQPFALLPSQSPKPSAHAPVYVHALVAQLIVPTTLATAVAQFVPHAPQFAVAVVRSTSQPFVRLSLSQSPKPLSHDPLQLPPLHVGEAMCELEHAMLQPPQWLACVFVLISQPFDRLLPSQSAKSASQEAPSQLPPLHASEMLLAEHAMLQPPH